MHIFENALIFHPCTEEWIPGSFSVSNGKIVAVGPVGSLSGDEVTNLQGARVIPGLIDAHVHVESSLLTPASFGDVVLRHGVTTVIADPHEIGNVAGTHGIDFMLENADASPADIFFMMPSCVPATPADVGGAVISSADLAQYLNHPRVLGLGEMMNVPGVLSNDPEVRVKLDMFSRVDGHAPGLSGENLCRYIACGIRTDHECTTAEEAREKLRRGMYIFLREGDAARDVASLAPAVTPATVSHCCFCTDDRHVDSLIRDGSIDHCIRVAVSAGMPLSRAIRMATLSAAECFGLMDRGLIAPGRVADFCTLTPDAVFSVREVYKGGVLIEDIPKRPASAKLDAPPFTCVFPSEKDLMLPRSGTARVIELIWGEIVTQKKQLPPTENGVQKIVAVDRYAARGFAVGLVKGFGMRDGAIATSISHDAHNIIATGATDADILTAIHAVAEAEGGMVVVTGDKVTLLPLPCGGLMTEEAVETVQMQITALEDHLAQTGTSPAAFMHLSFLSLTVVPHLKITPRGLFDGDVFADVPLFL